MFRHGTSSQVENAARPPALLGPVCAVAMLMGVAACLSLPQVPHWGVSALLACAGLFAWCWPWRARWAGIALFGFALTALHATFSLSHQLSPALEPAEWQIEGRVRGLPEHEARRTRFRFRIESADASDALDGREVMLSWYDDFGAATPGPRLRLRAGERWRFQVRLRAPRGLRNPGGFDSERHALVQRLSATGYVRKPQSAQRLQAARGLAAWRERMSARIGQGVANPSSRFIRAMALGIRAV